MSKIIYHPFRKTVKSKNGKEVKRWYYWWQDPVTNVQHQKLIPDVQNKAEAYAYVSKLEDPVSNDCTLIKNIAETMFEDNSSYLQRMAALSKPLSYKTLLQHRYFNKLIIEAFGNKQLEKLTVVEVTNYLMAIEDKSGSWKNSFISTLTRIYDEANWKCNKAIPKPIFPTFARKSKKADILTTEELNAIFHEELWPNEREYLLFFCIASLGLRLGEARALKPKQFFWDINFMIVDGFCKNTGERTNYNKAGSDENNKYRVAPIPNELKLRLLSYIEKNNIRDEDFLFQRQYGLPMRQEYLEKTFERMLNNVGIDKGNRKLVPHSLRFTYVTRMRRNLTVEDVKKIVGHTSVKMTEYYTRAAIPEMVAGLQEALPAANLLFE